MIHQRQIKRLLSPILWREVKILVLQLNLLSKLQQWWMLDIGLVLLQRNLLLCSQLLKQLIYLIRLLQLQAVLLFLQSQNLYQRGLLSIKRLLPLRLRRERQISLCVAQYFNTLSLKPAQMHQVCLLCN